jgi:hypothetical protein
MILAPRTFFLQSQHLQYKHSLFDFIQVEDLASLVILAQLSFGSFSPPLQIRRESTVRKPPHPISLPVPLNCST